MNNKKSFRAEHIRLKSNFKMFPGSIGVKRNKIDFNALSWYNSDENKNILSGGIM